MALVTEAELAKIIRHSRNENRLDTLAAIDAAAARSIVALLDQRERKEENRKSGHWVDEMN